MSSADLIVSSLCRVRFSSTGSGGGTSGRWSWLVRGVCGNPWEASEVVDALPVRLTAACRFVVELAAEGSVDGAAVTGADSIRNGAGRRMLPARVCRLTLPDLPTTEVATLAPSS